MDGQGSQKTGEKPGVEYDAAIRGKHLAACVEKINL